MAAGAVEPRFGSATPLYPWLNRQDPFDPATLFAHPGTRAGFTPHDAEVPLPAVVKRVCIVGGGIAGLTAAYELRRAGHEVSVLERSEQVGGRIRTVHFADGTYGELGAMRIPGDHTGVLHYVDEVFHLPKRPFRPGNPDGFLHLRSGCLPIGPLRMRQRQLLAGCYPNADPSTFWNLPADHVGNALSAAKITGSGWWDLFEGWLADTTINEAERISMWQALAAPRAPGSWPAQRFNPDEWEYLGRASGFRWLEDASLLEHMVDAAALLRDDKWELRGGMDRLVKAFADALGDRIILSAEAKAIRIESVHPPVGTEEPPTERVVVTWIDRWGLTTRDFDFAIVALPAPAVARLQFTPRLAAAAYEALTSISYASAAKTVVHCRRRVWEDQGIVGGSSHTDLPIQQCWYPSDHWDPTSIEDVPDDTPLRVSDRGVIPAGSEAEHPGGGGRYEFDDSFEVASMEGHASASSRAPGAFIGAYMWGANAKRFATLKRRERDELVISSLAEFHPGIRGVIDEVVHQVWDEDTVPGYGAFAFFKPGEFRRYQRALMEPHPSADSPRVFFAGEHLAVLHAWIQSAVLTAWSAASRVLSA